MKSYTILMLATFLAVSGVRADTEQKVDQLLRTIEFGDSEKMAVQDLPVESLPIFEAILKKADGTKDSRRVIALFAIKYEQFENKLTEAEKFRYCRVAIQTCKATSNEALPYYLKSLERMRHPTVKTYASSLMRSDNIMVRNAANRVVMAAPKGSL